jgi:small subunit ribosomal protein S1
VKTDVRDISTIIEQVRHAKTDNFAELTAIAGLDPAKDFQSTVLRGANFTGCDLSGFDFSGATIIESSFEGARFGNARFEGTKFSLVDLSKASDWDIRRSTEPIMYLKWSPDQIMLDSGTSENRTIGRVLALENDVAVVDVGRGFCRRVNQKMIRRPLEDRKLLPGDTVSIPVHIAENAPAYYFDDEDPTATPLTWDGLEQAYRKRDTVFGMIVRSVRAGFLVNVGGTTAFLPSSQVDFGWPPDVSNLLERQQPFEILSLGSREEPNVIVSRLAVLKRAEQAMCDLVLSDYKLGEIVEGVVQRHTDVGIIVDMMGLSGFLHHSELATENPSQINEDYAVGAYVKVAIIGIDKKKRRLSLSVKAVEHNPWPDFLENYKVGTQINGDVIGVSDHGIHVDVAGIKCFAHISEVPADQRSDLERYYPAASKISAIIRSIDLRRSRVNLSITALDSDPWTSFLEHHAVGDIVEGKVTNVSEHGLFVDVAGVVGLVPKISLANDLHDRQITAGESVTVQIWSISEMRARLTLRLTSIDSQTSPPRVVSPGCQKTFDEANIGDFFEVTISRVKDRAFEVSLNGRKIGFIPVSKLEWPGARVWHKNKPKILGKPIRCTVFDKDLENKLLVFGTKGTGLSLVQSFAALFQPGDLLTGKPIVDTNGTVAVDLLNGLKAEILASTKTRDDFKIDKWCDFRVVEIDIERSLIVVE